MVDSDASRLYLHFGTSFAKFQKFRNLGIRGVGVGAKIQSAPKTPQNAETG